MADFFTINIFPMVLTLTAFRIGQWCQKKGKLPLFNPILIGMILVTAFLLAAGMDVQVYKAGMSHLSWLMTPATISLAIPMYEQFRMLKRNLKAIVLGVAAGAVSCLALLLAGGILLGLEETILISLLPKSVTTAIGVPLSELSGGMGGVTTVAIIVTGILGNMLGTTFSKWFGLTDGVARGVALGTSAHVIGTSKASELDALMGAVSSLSLVAAGLLTAVLLPVFVSML